MQRRGELDDVGAFVLARLGELADHDLLHVLRQPLHGATVGQDPVAVPDVLGQAAVLLHLVQLGGGDDRQRVLLALHQLGLQGRVELVEVDRGGTRPKRLKQRRQDGRGGDADLESLEVVRRLDRLGRGGDVAEAVGPARRGGEQAHALDLRFDVLAEAAVQSLIDLVVRGEGKADVYQARGRNEGRQDGGGLVEELHPAVAHLAQQIGVRSELIGREEADLQFPARRLANAVDRLLRALVHGVGGVLAGSELVAELGGIGRACADGEQRQRSAGREQRPAGYPAARPIFVVHCCLPPWWVQSGQAVTARP